MQNQNYVLYVYYVSKLYMHIQLQYSASIKTLFLKLSIIC